MLNYFDVVTPEELERQYEEKPTPEFIAERRAYYEKEPGINYENLFLIYIDRGQEEIAKQYLNMIKDEDRKLDASVSAYECL